MTSTTASTRSDGTRSTTTNRVLVIAILVVAFAILMLGLYIAATGLVTRSAPRTLIEKSIDSMAGYVQQYPKNPAAWGDYAKALTVGKQYTRALGVINTGESKLGKRPELTFERARLAVARNDLKSALTYLKLAETELAAERKATLNKMGKGGTFVSPYGIKPDLGYGIQLTKAQVYGTLKQWADAKQSLTAALLENPTSADALILRGQAELKLGDKRAAANDFRAALKFVPGDAAAEQGLKDAGVETK